MRVSGTVAWWIRDLYEYRARMPSLCRPLSWMALSLTLGSCGGKVVFDTERGGDAGTPPESRNALVIKPPVSDHLCTFDEADPSAADTIFVLAASHPITCAQPDLLPSPSFCAPDLGGTVWQLCIPLAPDHLTPSTLDLTTEAHVNYDIVGPACGGYAGWLDYGTFTITTVDDTSVKFTLAGMNKTYGDLGEVIREGSYDGLRCP